MRDNFFVGWLLYGYHIESKLYLLRCVSYRSLLLSTSYCDKQLDDAPIPGRKKNEFQSD